MENRNNIEEPVNSSGQVDLLVSLPSRRMEMAEEKRAKYKCKRKGCKNYFERTRYTSRKIYCSIRCANIVQGYEYYKKNSKRAR